MAGVLSLRSVGSEAELVQEARSSMSSDRQAPDRSSRKDRCMLTSAVNLEQLVDRSWWTSASSKVELIDELEERWGIVNDNNEHDDDDSNDKSSEASASRQLWNHEIHTRSVNTRCRN